MLPGDSGYHGEVHIYETILYRSTCRHHGVYNFDGSKNPCHQSVRQSCDIIESMNEPRLGNLIA